MAQTSVSRSEHSDDMHTSSIRRKIRAYWKRENGLLMHTGSPESYAYVTMHEHWTLRSAFNQAQHSARCCLTSSIPKQQARLHTSSSLFSESPFLSFRVALNCIETYIVTPVRLVSIARAKDINCFGGIKRTLNIFGAESIDRAKGSTSLAGLEVHLLFPEPHLSEQRTSSALEGSKEHSTFPYNANHLSPVN
jgi:hypothetical protein